MLPTNQMPIHRALIFAVLALEHLYAQEENTLIKYEIRLCRATLKEMTTAYTLDRDRKIDKAKRMLHERPDLSQRQIAKLCGVSHQTVHVLSRQMSGKK